VIFNNSSGDSPPHVKEIHNKTNKKKHYLDNAKIHHSKMVKETLNEKNIETIYGIPYTPELRR